MKLSLFALAVPFILATGAVSAQERAAGGTTETQMTWAALSSQISGLATQVSGTNTRMDQLVVCGKKGMLYAPGQTGADGQGCLSAKAETPPVNPYRLTTQFFSEKTLPANTLTYCVNKGFDITGSVVPNTTTQMQHFPGGGSSGGGEDRLTTITRSYTISCIGSTLR